MILSRITRDYFAGIQKYQNNPTSTSLDTKDYSIHNIDFPGITICSNTKIMKSNFRAAMKAGNMPWKKLTEELIKDGTVQVAFKYLDNFFSIFSEQVSIQQLMTKESI